MTAPAARTGWIRAAVARSHATTAGGPNADDLARHLELRVAARREVLTAELADLDDDAVICLTAAALRDRTHLFDAFIEALAEGWLVRWCAIEVLAIRQAAAQMRAAGEV